LSSKKDNRVLNIFLSQKEATFATALKANFLMSRFNNQTYIPQLAIDCVIFGYKDKELKVLVSKLYLKGDIYSLPNGFIFQHESIDEAAQRILKNERAFLTSFYSITKTLGKPKEAIESSSKTSLNKIGSTSPAK
jgi:deoxyadenosine/deoxycytidine kinase